MRVCLALLCAGVLCTSSTLAQRSNRPTQANCCNTRDGQWAGVLSTTACLAKPGHFPDIAEYREQVKACSDPDQDQNDVEPDIEIDIPNGGFEQWSGGKPVGYGTFSTPEGSKVPIETVFQSNDAHTGEYSALIKNVPIPIPGMPEGISIPNLPNIPGMTGVQSIKPMMPGGIVSCQADCPINTGRKNARNMESMTFPIDGSADYFCGYYKANLVGGDQILLSMVTRSGTTIIGGTNLGDPLGAYLTKSVAEWTPFKLPIARTPDNQQAEADNGILEITIMPAGQGGQGWSAAGVNDGSTINIDTLHFCGPQVDLAVFHPKSAGGFQVPESKEDSIGAQAFPNFDNDDRDATFDRDSTKVVPGEDDLLLMLLQLPQDAAGGTAILTQRGGREAVKIWKTEDKTPGTEFVMLDQPFSLPGDFRDTGAALEKLLWVEPLKSTGKGEIAFEFSYENAQGRVEKDLVRLTVLGVSKIEWRGKDNSERDDGSGPLLIDPNYPSGLPFKAVRVYPGRRPERGRPAGVNRNKVEVVVTLNVDPGADVDLYLRAFDVDDPTASDNDVDMEDKADDNRGTKPAQTGHFVETASDITKITFKAGETQAAAEFQVTMRPGDNFQIVASADRDFLEQLEHDDKALFAAGGESALPWIVDKHVFADSRNAESSAVIEPMKYSGDVLTVWRFFYPEIDRMGPVEDNRITGSIVNIRDHTIAAGAQTRAGSVVTVDRNFFAEVGTALGNVGIANSFENGLMDITGSRSYNVTGNTANDSGNDDVYVWPPVPSNFIGSGFSVNDDDYRNGYDDNGTFSFPPDEGLERAFKPAYITPVIGALKNDVDMVPYKRNTEGDGQRELRALYVFNNEDIHALEDFWVVYILGAHQGTTKEDGDGEPAVLNGIADALDSEPGEGMGAIIFEEAVKERLAFEIRQGNPTDGLTWADSVAHEVGHLFGAAHGDDGLIDQKSSNFSPKSLLRIRSVDHP